MTINIQQNPKTGFQRKMSGPERRFLPLPNANIVMGARIRGQVTPGLLQSAVLKVQQKHPLLGIRIRLEEDATGWFTQADAPVDRAWDYDAIAGLLWGDVDRS